MPAVYVRLQSHNSDCTVFLMPSIFKYLTAIYGEEQVFARKSRVDWSSELLTTEMCVSVGASTPDQGRRSVVELLSEIGIRTASIHQEEAGDSPPITAEAVREPASLSSYVPGVPAAPAVAIGVPRPTEGFQLVTGAHIPAPSSAERIAAVQAQVATMGSALRGDVFRNIFDAPFRPAPNSGYVIHESSQPSEPES